ncbi:MAG: helix-hairpin-helix domain-containing protein [Anaerolineae bacterium]|nr:helix-hairpin-helix domain-containing protein [Anaerolineae bacterium]
MNEGMQRYRWVLASTLALAIVIGGVVLWRRWPRPGPIVISTPAPTQTPSPVPSPTPSPLRVYVSGAVVQPDVYLLPPGSIVKDALAAAGGATEHADLTRVNLAVALRDQQQVHVPCVGEGAPSAATTGPAPTVGPPAEVDINHASLEELDALPGIGPAIAQRIIDYREAYGGFVSPEEIMNVRGIGPSTYAEIEHLIVVR